MSAELIEAVMKNKASTVIKLLNNGANPNFVEDHCLISPLHFSAVTGTPEIVKTLISAGADINLKNADGLTPSDVATECHRTNIAEIIKGK